MLDDANDFQISVHLMIDHENVLILTERDLGMIDSTKNTIPALSKFTPILRIQSLSQIHTDIISVLLKVYNL